MRLIYFEIQIRICLILQEYLNGGVLENIYKVMDRRQGGH